jgi:hypothetical protein
MLNTQSELIIIITVWNDIYVIRTVKYTLIL